MNLFIGRSVAVLALMACQVCAAPQIDSGSVKEGPVRGSVTRVIPVGTDEIVMPGEKFKAMTVAWNEVVKMKGLTKKQRTLDNYIFRVSSTPEVIIVDIDVKYERAPKGWLPLSVFKNPLGVMVTYEVRRSDYKIVGFWTKG